MTSPQDPTKTDLELLPTRLSPSRAKTFLNCPQSFYFSTIKKLRSENTIATTQGTLAHTALEELFALPAAKRTLETALSFVAPAWEALRVTPEYSKLVEHKSAEEAKMLSFSKKMVANYFTIEDPTQMEPAALEYHAEADINGLALHGYIDRRMQAPIPAQNNEVLDIIDDYKGLALDTELPTPTGFTTMQDVQEGDLVLGTNGQPVPVTKKSGIHNRPCFEITTADGQTEVCDNVHLWDVIHSDNTQTETVEASHLYELVLAGPVFVEVPEALQLPDATFVPEVPASAFVAWLLGDTPEVRRIPTELLRAPLEYRVALLRELGHSDAGYEEDGLIEIRLSSEDLLGDVDELVATLGGVIVERTDFGRRYQCGSPTETIRREIVQMVPVASVPTQCISVDSPDSLYLVGRGMLPTHNTGKIPSPRYLDDAFFAMRVYALLLFKETGKIPYMLRLIYLRGNGQKAVRRVLVTQEMLERTERDIDVLWKRIRSAAATGNWPTKTGPLCNYCDYKPLCPAFGGAK